VLKPEVEMSGILDESRAELDTPDDKELEQPRRHSNASVSPTEYDGDDDVAPEHEAGERNEMELARTKSIAETLPLWREIIFVAIVSNAQLLTRKWCLYITCQSQPRLL